MKELVNDIVDNYLSIFNEDDRLSVFKNYLSNGNSESIIDWNNFDGHIVASGFIYAKDTKKFLVMYHNDLKMYLYPGGHMDSGDTNPLEAAKREVIEETGITDFTLYKFNDNELIPLDIDTHEIGYNERLNLPSHKHFDFRYLFIIDKEENVSLDEEELSDYKWVDIDTLDNLVMFGDVVKKIRDLNI